MEDKIDSKFASLWDLFRGLRNLPESQWRRFFYAITPQAEDGDFELLRSQIDEVTPSLPDEVWIEEVVLPKASTLLEQAGIRLVCSLNEFSERINSGEVFDQYIFDIDISNNEVAGFWQAMSLVYRGNLPPIDHEQIRPNAGLLAIIYLLNLSQRRVFEGQLSARDFLELPSRVYINSKFGTDLARCSSNLEYFVQCFSGWTGLDLSKFDFEVSVRNSAFFNKLETEERQTTLTILKPEVIKSCYRAIERSIADRAAQPIRRFLEGEHSFLVARQVSEWVCRDLLGKTENVITQKDFKDPTDQFGKGELMVLSGLHDILFKVSSADIHYGDYLFQVKNLMRPHLEPVVLMYLILVFQLESLRLPQSEQMTRTKESLQKLVKFNNIRGIVQFLSSNNRFNELAGASGLLCEVLNNPLLGFGGVGKPAYEGVSEEVRNLLEQLFSITFGTNGAQLAV